ncbi:M48 family metalloprotease [Planktothrix sp. FACHB-1355]|uniref:M48 family metalloprotease n=1 Tax=Aerosakkonema funiforme FACHB-1375 TaxID=2949571 RepID=A0A926VDJ0_9CYAN|nr:MULTISPECIES: M48 family metallopeptidase [Oscillatoriales]MBD2181826.1 M48 family metalloprotease [Aerosakkonema funiforme FACHB-1375]MBD3559699.1 M48 family metalloprotease [Planktothrix sp. FACHB-1355]
MLNVKSIFFARFRGRWYYPLLSALVALTLWVTALPATKALPLQDLILQGIQIIQLSKISDRQEVQIGGQINTQLLSSQFQLYRNSQIAEYVDRVGQRLASVSDRPNIPYRFQVVRDNSINAFATMGGFVYVTTGLLVAADNEAQLASVLGHEIGHIASRHSIEQMRQVAIERGLATAAGLNRNTMVRLGVDLAVNRPQSRKDELEADQRGLRNIRQAGYAESGIVGFMEKLLGQPSPPSFLSTHPAPKDRIVALERAIDPARANVGDGLDETEYRTNIRALLRSRNY